jgi:hypothetical protein
MELSSARYFSGAEMKNVEMGEAQSPPRRN